MDDRASATGIARYFLALMVGAIITWIVWEIGRPILDYSANASSNATANQGNAWLRTGIEHFPIYFLLLSLFGIVALAIYQRETLR